MLRLGTHFPLSSLLATMALLLVGMPATAQTASTADSKPASGKLDLKAALVLTPELCGSKDSEGSFWTSGKETFYVGKVFCAEVDAGLQGGFSTLTNITDPASAGDTQVVLLPKIVSFSKTQKSFAYLADIVVAVEWTVKDPAGKTVWIETVQGHARNQRGKMSSSYNKLIGEVLKAAIRDLLAQSTGQMTAAPELQKLINSRDGPAK